MIVLGDTPLGDVVVEPHEPLITVTVGPRNAHTDAKTGLRFYRWDERELPSVTTIRRMAGLPFFLHQWTITQVVNRAVEQQDELHRMLTRARRPRERVLEKNRIKEAKTWLRKAATDERDRAADLGTRVHDHATRGVPLVEAEPDVAARLHQFYDWLLVSGAEIIATERQVFNLHLGYAGTFDLLCYFPRDWSDRDTGELLAREGDVVMVDLKTGKSTYTEHAIQLIGYLMAEFVGEDNVVDLANTEALLGLDRMALLHLGDEFWTWKEVRPTSALYRAFRGLLVFATFAYEHADMDALVAEHAEGSA